MKKKIPLPLVIAVSIFLFSIIITFLVDIIFQDLRQSIVVGLIVLILSTLFEFRLAVEASNKGAATTLNQATDRLVSLLKIHNSYFSDNSLLTILEDIVSLRQVAGKQVHDLVRFEKIITNALEEAKRELGNDYRIDTKDNELDRIARLKTTVDKADKYIYAVTYDVDDYLNKFWSKIFKDGYVKSNIDAVQRGTSVERIFIVEKKIIENKGLSSEEQQKHDNLLTLVKSLKRGRCKVFISAIEDLPESLKQTNTSFLVCDDYVGSESNGVTLGKLTSGYVSYGNSKKVVDLLKDRFSKLKQYSRESW